MAAPPDRWSQLHRLATPQHGLVTRRQALAAGFSASAVSRAVARGEWVRVVSGVFALSGVGVTPMQRVAAAVLVDASVAATGWTAMWLWRLVRTAPSPVEVVVPHGRRGPSGRRIAVHRSRTLTPVDVTEVRGVRAVTVARALVDLAARAELDALRRMAIDGRQQELVTVAGLRAALRRAGPVAGAPALRHLIDELDAETSDSMLEHRARRRLHAAGLHPHPEPWPVTVTGTTVVLDIAFPEYRVAIEVDGFAYHSTPRQLARDHERHNFLLPTDWKILRIGWADVEHRFDAVLAQLRSLLVARGWQPGS